jgi:DNA-binding LytR/AlgR family response regulator
MILHDNAKHLFSFNLSHFQRIIEIQLKAEASMFIRLGRSIIVNREYIYKINISKQEMVLSDKNLNEAFTISASKEALKQLKSLLESEIAK